MPTFPKVSVIMTSYNHAKYLRQAIESVLAQTFRDFELIIWDDGSADDSWQIINSYSDPRILAFRNEVNLHGGNVRRALAQAAPAQYVAIQHCDDIWEPEKLERQVAFLDENPQIGAVFTWVSVIDADGSPFEDETHFYHHIFDQSDRSRHEWLNYFFYQGNALCHPSAMLHRVCYDECGLYRPGMAQLPDFDMWVRLCLKYEIRVLPERLVRFRVHSNEVNSSGNRPETRVRAQFEYLQLLNNYKSVRNAEDFLKVFPSAEKYMKTSGFDPDFALGMLALEAGWPTRELFGLTVLFEALNDPARAERINQLYGFSHADFVALSGRYDFFSLEALAGLHAEKQALVSQNEALTAQVLELRVDAEQLAAIYRSRSWRLLQPLRALYARLAGLDSQT
jgi:glycosyltransferase involved in cell wall biosynthesis